MTTSDSPAKTAADSGSQDTAPLAHVERGVRALLLNREDTFMPDVDRRGQEAYRDLVQRSLTGVILNACPVAHARLALENEGGLRPLIGRFLEERGPSTRLYRDIPMDFARWLTLLAEDDSSVLPHPSLGELVAWEVLEIDVLLAPDPEPQLVERRPRDDLALVFDPSLRLAAHQFPVHRLKKKRTNDDEPAFPEPGGPWIIVAWRGAERFNWRTVRPAFGQLLAVAAQSGAPLADVFDDMRGMGQRVDEAYLRSQLVDFVGRGALLGFAPPDVPDVSGAVLDEEELREHGLSPEED